jgi:hypothetical protein
MLAAVASPTTATMEITSKSAIRILRVFTIELPRTSTGALN